MGLTVNKMEKWLKQDIKKIHVQHESCFSIAQNKYIIMHIDRNYNNKLHHLRHNRKEYSAKKIKENLVSISLKVHYVSIIILPICLTFIPNRRRLANLIETNTHPHTLNSQSQWIKPFKFSSASEKIYLIETNQMKNKRSTFDEQENCWVNLIIPLMREGKCIEKKEMKMKPFVTFCIKKQTKLWWKQGRMERMKEKNHEQSNQKSLVCIQRNTVLFCSYRNETN